MKRFIANTAAFTAILASLLCMMIVCTLLIASRISFAMPRDRHIAVIGDSYTACAIDDSIFSKSINISNHGEAYLYSYIKLKRILEENTHIDTALLSFHNGSGSLNDEKRLISNEAIRNHVPGYFFLMGKDEYVFFRNNPAFFVSILRIPFINIRKILVFVIKKGVMSYKDFKLGQYSKANGYYLPQAIEKQEENLKNRENVKTDEFPSYVYQTRYLQKIIDLCKEKNVELILFNSPTYRPDRYANNKQLMEYYNTYLRGTRYMDFSDFPLPEYGYRDIGHLNYKGAEIFSRYLRDNYEELFTPAPR